MAALRAYALVSATDQPFVLPRWRLLRHEGDRRLERSTDQRFGDKGIAPIRKDRGRERTIGFREAT